MMLAVSQAIDKISLGYGIVHLVDSETRGALGLDSPKLVANVWNMREASDDAVNRLWTKMNRGQDCQWYNLDYAVVIGVSGRTQLDPTWVSNPAELVKWAPGVRNTTIVNINGNHRRVMIRKKILEPEILPLIEVSPNFSADRRKALQLELQKSSRWVAQLIDLSQSYPLAPTKVPWNLTFVYSCTGGP